VARATVVTWVFVVIALILFTIINTVIILVLSVFVIDLEPAGVIPVL
jgi:hypothetical protein